MEIRIDARCLVTEGWVGGQWMRLWRGTRGGVPALAIETVAGRRPHNRYAFFGMDQAELVLFCLDAVARDAETNKYLNRVGAAMLSIPSGFGHQLVFGWNDSPTGTVYGYIQRGTDFGRFSVTFLPSEARQLYDWFEAALGQADRNSSECSLGTHFVQ